MTTLELVKGIDEELEHLPMSRRSHFYLQQIMMNAVTTAKQIDVERLQSNDGEDRTKQVD